MNGLLIYLLKSAVCLVIFFLFYRLFLTRDTHFKLVRGYLLISIFLSLALPISKYALHIDYFNNEPKQLIVADPINTNMVVAQEKPIIIEKNTEITTPQSIHKIDWKKIAINTYFIISIILLCRLLLHLAQLFSIIFRSERIRKDSYILVFNKKENHSFSFFNWIILNKSNVASEEMSEIIAHESIHASQYHSLDLILIELLAAVMWFNPVVWMMRNAFQLVHEYLADEGALSTGLDKLQYQALLVNQVAEEKLICLSSSFNHSLIKKRIVMMTKSKFNQKTKLKILSLFPIAVVLFMGIACVNGQNTKDEPKVVTAVAPTRMNVLYIGVDNPMSIAVSGYNAEDLTVTIDNGTIAKSGNEYIINPKEKGRARVTVFAKGNKVSETEFRVKFMPDPVAKIAGLKGGTIDKSVLMQQTGIIIDLENFDFDARFTAVSFVMSTTFMDQKGQSVINADSHSDKFSEQQINLIKKLKADQKLYISDITVVGPDGMKRKLAPMIFTVIDK